MATPKKSTTTKSQAPATPATTIPNQTVMFNGATIHIAEEMNLTEMWRASKKSVSHNPNNWMRKEGSEFIKTMHSNATDSRISIRTKRGQGGGTFAHWQIGMEYARYLSPELAAICNQIVKDYVNADPNIAVSVVARTSKAGVAQIAAVAIDHTNDPVALEIIKNRAESKVINLQLNGEMARRGGESKTMAIIAAENCLAVTNMFPRDIKKAHHRPNRSSARDLLVPLDLKIVSGLEALQIKKLMDSDADGHFEILDVALPVAKAFRQMTARLGLQREA